jgi:excisionase family DNA binding protein
MPSALIGRRRVALVHGSLQAHEAAFVLRCSEREVRNMLRRGALPAAWVGRLRRVDVVELAERLAGDELALQALGLIAEGRLRVPRDPGERPTLSAAVAAAGGAQGIAHASALVSDTRPGGASRPQFILDNSTKVAPVSASSDAGDER